MDFGMFLRILLFSIHESQDLGSYRLVCMNPKTDLLALSSLDN